MWEKEIVKLWNKNYILLLQGNAVSAIGDVLYSVAIGYWVYEQTGSSALMGIMSSISMFVMMFVQPFSGSIVDKSNRKVLIVGMDALRGIIMLVVGVMALTDNLSVPVVLIAAFLAALCSVFFGPSVSTVLIDIIPHDEIVRGQSVQSGITSLINLVGKAFSGALVAFVGVPLIITLNGVTYLISAFTELFIDVPKTKRQGEKVTVSGILSDFKTAFVEIFTNKFLKIFIPSAMILNLLGSGPSSLMLPFILEKGFTVEQYGFFMSVETAASLICVFLLGVFRMKKATRYYLMAAGFIASCFFYIITYLSKDFLWMCVWMFIGCFVNCVGNSIFSATIVLAMPEENRAGMLGLFSATSMGGCALSAVFFGILGELMPLYLLFVIGNVVSIPLMVWMCLHKNTKEFILEH